MRRYIFFHNGRHQAFNLRLMTIFLLAIFLLAFPPNTRSQGSKKARCEAAAPALTEQEPITSPPKNQFRIKGYMRNFLTVNPSSSGWTAIVCPSSSSMKQIFEMRDKIVYSVLDRTMVLTMKREKEGSIITFEPFTGDCNQQWVFNNDDTIRNVNNYYLDVKRNPSAPYFDGADVTTSTDCNNMQWTRKASDPRFYIQNVNSKMVVDIKGKSKVAKTELIMSSIDGTSSQLWYKSKKGIFSSLNGKAMTVTTKTRTKRTKVMTNRWDTGNDKVWEVRSDGHIVVDHYKNSLTQEGSNLVATPVTTSDNQNFEFVYV